MANIIVDKFVNIISNHHIKLTILIIVLLKKGLLNRLDMKYWKSDDNTTDFKIIDFHCMLLDFSKTYGIMKDNF
jgi:hypothetical protein